MTLIPDDPYVTDDPVSETTPGPLDPEPGLPPNPDPNLPPEPGPDTPDFPQPDPLTDAAFSPGLSSASQEESGETESGEPPFPMRSYPETHPDQPEREEHGDAEPPFPMHSYPKQSFPSFAFPKDTLSA